MTEQPRTPEVRPLDARSVRGLAPPELTRELIQKMHALVDSCRDLAVEDDDAAQVRIHTHAFPIND